MKTTITTLVLSGVACLLMSASVEARERCCRPRNNSCNRGASAAGFFAGALAGAFSGVYADAYYDGYYPPPYYGYGPRPLYGYDYPAFAYNPMYAYRSTTWGYYPFGY